MSDIDYLKKYYDGDINVALEKLNNGIPVQYIVGNVDFYGYNFIVNPSVLIPRFETEDLVNRTIKYVQKYFSNPLIVDLGCGSGCIGITLSKELNITVDALDISLEALNVAKENCRRNDAQVNFYLGDMSDPLSKKYDVIISNPPYIAYDEKIEDIVKKNEPSIALYALDNGLYFYKQILKNANKYLNKRSMLAFEIGYLQGDSLKKMAGNYFPDSVINVEKDLSGRDRFLFIFNNLSS